MDDQLTIAGKTFNSRLMTGTGKHKTVGDLMASVEKSQTEIITVAIRRLNLDNPNEKQFSMNSIGIIIRSYLILLDPKPLTKQCLQLNWPEKSLDQIGSRSR